MRGVYTATYLSGLAKIFARRRGLAALDIGTGLDLICGTSTGAIVASALACGLQMSDVVRLYEAHGQAIFPTRLPKTIGISLLRDLFERPRRLRAGTLALRSALEERLGQVTLSDVYRTRGIALAIPAVALSNHRSWVFKTSHLPNSSGRDDAVRLVDACLASSAAPVFRSIAVIDATVTGSEARQAFVDGGLWANNPVLVGLIDALEMTSPGNHIEIFCLGTVPVPAGQTVPEDEVDRGLVGWRFGGLAAGLSIDAQHFAYDNMARMLSRHVDRYCRIYRFPAENAPASLLPFLDLDDSRPEAISALQRQAGSDADMTNSACGDNGNAVGQAICQLFAGERMRPTGERPVLGPEGG